MPSKISPTSCLKVWYHSNAEIAGSRCLPFQPPTLAKWSTWYPSRLSSSTSSRMAVRFKDVETIVLGLALFSCRSAAATTSKNDHMTILTPLCTAVRTASHRLPYPMRTFLGNAFVRFGTLAFPPNANERRCDAALISIFRPLARIVSLYQRAELFGVRSRLLKST